MDILLIGHVTADITPNGQKVLGGPVSYVGTALAKLGHTVTICTKADPNSPFLKDLESQGIAVVNLGVESDGVTTFTNTYSEGHRTQWMDNVAASFTDDDLSTIVDLASFRHGCLILPVANEIPAQMYKEIAEVNTNIISAPQGSLRVKGEGGLVEHVSFSEEHLAGLQTSKILTISQEDISGFNEAQVHQLKYETAETVIITDGKGGSTIYHQGEEPYHIDTFELTDEENEGGYHTGNGDYFTAMLTHFLDSKLLNHTSDTEYAEYLTAVELAVIRASFFTAMKIMPWEGKTEGLGSIPDLDHISNWVMNNQARLSEYSQKFSLERGQIFDPEIMPRHLERR